MHTPLTRVILRLVAVAVAVLAVPGLAPDALAQADSAAVIASTGARLTSLYDRLQVTVSGSGVFLDAHIRLDGSQGNIGTDLDAEDDLGLDQVIIEPRFAVRWRPGRIHELEGGYQFARRTAGKTLERQLDFGDSTYNAGIRIESVLDTDQAFLNYRVAALAKENWQAGVALGLGALFLKMGLSAEANPGLGQAAIDVEKSIVGPLGSIGIYGRYLGGDRWYLEGDARAIQIAIDRFDVSVLEANVAARYFIKRSLGVEAGLGTSRVTVDISKRDDREFSASARVKYSLANVRFGVVWVP